MPRSIAVRQKNHYNNAMGARTPILISGAMLAGMITLAGCGTASDAVPCPPITASQEGVRVSMRADKTGQLFDVRLNGVEASCSATKLGSVAMKISVGLKMKRDLGQGIEADIVEIPMMTAIVGSDNRVIDNARVSSKAGFSKNEAVKYPVATLNQILPADARLVISLLPAS